MNASSLQVISETNHFIVVIKPSGILSQADSTKDENMMCIVKAYLKEKYHKPGNVFLGLIHRLDRMTSGLMVFAKTSKGASRLSEQIRTHQFHKKYVAVVEGNIEEGATLMHQLEKNEKEVKSYVVKNGGKEAILHYEPLFHFESSTIIEVDLVTGRHHQIRVQLSAIGHPLKGDTLYGSKAKPPFLLHAYYLSFKDPITNEQYSYIEYPSWYKEKVEK